MKIVEIIGGLGNQMFQYALYEALKAKFPDEEILVDSSLFSKYKLHHGLELPRIWGISLKNAKKKQIRRLRYNSDSLLLSRILRRLPVQKKTTCIERSDMRYDPTILSQEGDRYFSGYWQNSRYFDDIRCRIQEVFTFDSFSSSENCRIHDKIMNNENSVGIHVRRGDYLSNRLFRGICTIDYYQKALSLLLTNKSKCHFFIFSNDIMWCKKNIQPLLANSPCTFVNNNSGTSSWIDMQLLSCCRHQIIANSSFSWWASYLNRAEDSFVIAPERWKNKKSASKIQLPNWHLI